LTTELETAANHYVRCIKPNEEKKNLVLREFILRQIKYMGIFETIEIRKRIFPFRKSYEEMAYLFDPIFKQAKGKAPRLAVDIILSEMKVRPNNYLLGTRRIYMSEPL
jgi:myosin heavy subunit